MTTVCLGSENYKENTSLYIKNYKFEGSILYFAKCLSFSEFHAHG